MTQDVLLARMNTENADVFLAAEGTMLRIRTVADRCGQVPGGIPESDTIQTPWGLSVFICGLSLSV